MIVLVTCSYQNIKYAFDNFCIMGSTLLDTIYIAYYLHMKTCVPILLHDNPLHCNHLQYWCLLFTFKHCFWLQIYIVLDKFVAPILFFPHRFYVKIAVSKNDINCCWNKYRCQQRNPSLWLDLKYTGYTLSLILRCLCKIFSIDNIQISYLILILRCTIISFQWHC